MYGHRSILLSTPPNINITRAIGSGTECHSLVMTADCLPAPIYGAMGTDHEHFGQFFLSSEERVVLLLLVVLIHQLLNDNDLILAAGTRPRENGGHGWARHFGSARQVKRPRRPANSQRNREIFGTVLPAVSLILLHL